MSTGLHRHDALTVVVDSARELDSALGSAIGTLQERAIANPCCGILVSTRLPSTKASRSASRSSAPDPSTQEAPGYRRGPSAFPGPCPERQGSAGGVAVRAGRLSGRDLVTLKAGSLGREGGVVAGEEQAAAAAREPGLLPPKPRYEWDAVAVAAGVRRSVVRALLCAPVAGAGVWAVLVRERIPDHGTRDLPALRSLRGSVRNGTPMIGLGRAARQAPQSPAQAS